MNRVLWTILALSLSAALIYYSGESSRDAKNFSMK